MLLGYSPTINFCLSRGGWVLFDFVVDAVGPLGLDDDEKLIPFLFLFELELHVVCNPATPHRHIRFLGFRVHRDDEKFQCLVLHHFRQKNMQGLDLPFFVRVGFSFLYFIFMTLPTIRLQLPPVATLWAKICF